MTTTNARDAGLRAMLGERRREIQDDVQSRIRDGRADRPAASGDEVERADASSQGELDAALLQMRTETLVRIDQALVRLEAGDYGSCVACGIDIAEARLRALPFAVRCRGCEEKRERERGRAGSTPRAGFSLFAGMPGS